jgi:hypothetical protein
MREEGQKPDKEAGEWTEVTPIPRIVQNYRN